MTTTLLCSLLALCAATQAKDGASTRGPLSSKEEQLCKDFSAKDLEKIGTVLKNAGEYANALPYLRAAVAVNKDNPALHWTLADVCLTLGDYWLGFAEFKHRWKNDPRYEHKLWEGQDLNQKTLLVHDQWDIDNLLRYLRYFAGLKAQGAKIILKTHLKHAKILVKCDVIDQIIVDEIPSDFYDYQVPITALPEVLQTTLTTVPHQVPYLELPAKLLKKWKSYFAQDQKFKIGIYFNGDVPEPLCDEKPYGQESRTRIDVNQLPFAHLLPILKHEELSCYSLRQDSNLKKIALCLPRDVQLHLFDEESFDKKNGYLVDTAAVMKQLDLVITQDTKIGELAGALGIPVWVILPPVADWFWLLERSDSPWYPTMTLFRQKKFGDLTLVGKNLLAALQPLIAQHKHTHRL